MSRSKCKSSRIYLHTYTYTLDCVKLGTKANSVGLTNKIQLTNPLLEQNSFECRGPTIFFNFFRSSSRIANSDYPNYFLNGVFLSFGRRTKRSV